MISRISDILPFLLAADLIIPFLLAPRCKGYSHLRQVMSVLGNSKAPLHLVYNIWLVLFGASVVAGAIELYPALAEVSGTIAILMLSILLIYAAGACILSGFFSVGETKSLDTLPEKIHGYGSAIGFSLLTLAPLLSGFYFFKVSEQLLAALSFICFILAAGFFALFIMADKPRYQGTAVSLEGLWQRLSLLSMYLPIMALCFRQQ